VLLHAYPEDEFNDRNMWEENFTQTHNKHLVLLFVGVRFLSVTSLHDMNVKYFETFEP